MKYWVFEHGDVVGPFTTEEIKKRSAFSGETLICPENAADDHLQWKPAAFFDGFSTAGPGQTPPAAQKTLKEDAPAPADISIDDYFRDFYDAESAGLSDILGIPRDLADSDLHLGRFLQDNIIGKPSKRKNTEIKAIPPSANQPETYEEYQARRQREGEAHQKSISSKIINPAAAPAPSAPDPLEDTIKLSPVKEEVLAPVQKETSAQKPQQQQQPAPAHGPEEIVPAQPAHAAAQPAPDATERAKRENSFNTIDFDIARRKVTGEAVNLPKKTKQKPFIFYFSMVLVFFGALFGIVYNVPGILQPSASPARPAALIEPPAQSATKAEVKPEVNAAPLPIVPAPTLLEARIKEAVEVAKKYQLSANRGELEAYFNGYFKNYFEQGYASAWSAEHLYRDSYIVKYRLVKPRKEPIVYIFETDLNKKTIVGALNNSAMDLLDL